MVDPAQKLPEPRKKRGRPTKQEAEERRRAMEERSQRRLQAQAAQTMQPSPLPQPLSTYGPPYAPVHDPGPYAAHGPLPREPTPAGPVIPPPITASAQTPQRAQGEDQPSSGSSGKRRKLRPPRLSVSDSEVAQPPPFRLTTGIPQSSTMHDPGLEPAAAFDQRHFGHMRASPGSSGLARAEPDMPRYDPDDDNRPPNPRSRPWEVMERSGP